jgi:hypothetical protein
VRPASIDRPTPVVATLPPPRSEPFTWGKPTDDLNALVEKMPASSRFVSRTEAKTPPRHKVRPGELLAPPSLPSGAPPVSATVVADDPEAEVPLALILRQPPQPPPMPDPVYGAD